MIFVGLPRDITIIEMFSVSGIDIPTNVTTDMLEYRYEDYYSYYDRHIANLSSEEKSAIFHKISEYIAKNRGLISFYGEVGDTSLSGISDDGMKITLGNKEYSLNLIGEKRKEERLERMISSIKENYERKYNRLRRASKAVFPSYINQAIENSTWYYKEDSNDLRMILKMNFLYVPQFLFGDTRKKKINEDFVNVHFGQKVSGQLEFCLRSNELVLYKGQLFKQSSRRTTGISLRTPFSHYHSMRSGDCLGSLEGAKANCISDINGLKDRFINGFSIINTASLASNHPNRLPDVNMIRDNSTEMQEEEIESSWIAQKETSSLRTRRTEDENPF